MQSIEKFENITKDLQWYNAINNIINIINYIKDCVEYAQPFGVMRNLDTFTYCIPYELWAMQNISNLNPTAHWQIDG